MAISGLLRYHIGVAACQLALLIEARGKGGAELPLAEKMLYAPWRATGLKEPGVLIWGFGGGHQNDDFALDSH